jgi:hypothetical protein
MGPQLGVEGIALNASTLSQNRASAFAFPAILFLNALLKDELKATSIIEQHSFELVCIV